VKKNDLEKTEGYNELSIEEFENDDQDFLDEFRREFRDKKSKEEEK